MTSPRTQDAYRAAGVDTDAATRGLEGLFASLRQTFELRPEGRGRVLTGFGHYAGLIELTDTLALAIATDGVGSKILVAELAGRYDRLGIDLVAMNANDLICVGAEPLVLVDYIATERLDAAVLAELGRGLLEGARQAGITVPAGEIAQLPEMIRGARTASGIDLVGTCVGTVDRRRLLTGERVTEGDVVVGLAASGLHSNGYTLARRVLLADAGLDLAATPPGLGRPLAEELLEPTVIYVRAALEMLRTLDVHGLAHITGDGLLNLLRLRAGVSFEIDTPLEPPPIFALIARLGGIAPREMHEVFNMGTGLVVAVAAAEADAVCRIAAAHGHRAATIGRIVDDGRGEVRLPAAGLVLGGTGGGEAGAGSPAGGG
jgi:phosphoribosylformylglycinamidine cyclo-ligase